MLKYGRLFTASARHLKSKDNPLYADNENDSICSQRPHQNKFAVLQKT